MRRLGALTFWIAGLHFFVGASLANASLFQWMQGSWQGSGERVFYATGQRVQIEAQVSSGVVSEVLISQNDIRETIVLEDGTLGATREYRRVYWIREKGDPTTGVYELGYGEDTSIPPASTGRLDGNSLEVEQKMGDAFLIRSRTEFLPDETVYTETTTLEGKAHSQTTIRYRRRPIGT